MSKIEFQYEKMFNVASGHNPSDDHLNRLADSMTDQLTEIDAGYTYLGQFIDHDMAFDSMFRTYPWEEIPVSSVVNMRTPHLNLETIYGFDSPRNKDEPTRSELMQTGSNTLLKLGETEKSTIVNRTFANKDLPRFPDKPTAWIVDHRNDENLVVAQTQVAFMRFHNAVLKYLNSTDTNDTFEEAQKIVIQHYQWIILHDYLPKIIKKSVINDVLANGNRFYDPDPDCPFMPLEFSVAAYRMGHSMIRGSYNWNIFFNNDPFPEALPATLQRLVEFTGRGGLGGRQKLVSHWLINWNWFYDTSINAQNQKLNHALPIDTRLANPLGRIPDRNGKIPGTFNRQTSLAALDLYRGRAFGIPSGQEIAKAILGKHQQVLLPEQISCLFPDDELRSVFSGDTPLWFYLLAEAEIVELGQRMGEVGSRIIAETFIKLIRLSEHSILECEFEPNDDFCDSKGFGMAAMLKFISRIERSSDAFDPLDPLSEIDLCDEVIVKLFAELKNSK